MPSVFFFFWCHRIYWLTIRCSFRAGVKWWRPLSFKIKLSRSAARRSHYVEIMNRREILSNHAHFSVCHTDVIHRRETWTVWNMLSVTSLIYNDSRRNQFGTFQQEMNKKMYSWWFKPHGCWTRLCVCVTMSLTIVRSFLLLPQSLFSNTVVVVLTSP